MEENNNRGGIGFLGVLTLIFITLKLLEQIDWSWWWVLSPILIPLVFFGSLYIIFTILSLIFD